MNILLMHTHDTGRMVEPYGHQIPTPRLQQFAEEGVLFRHAYSGAPTCSPSRAALLTGQAAHSAGMLGLTHRGFALSDPSQHLAHTLTQAGYTTAAVGVQHVAGTGQQKLLGYTAVLPVDSDRAEAVTPVAESFLRRDHDRPFFLSVGFLETHVMDDPAGRFGYRGVDERYVPVPSTLPDCAEVRQDIADFAAAAAVVDAAMGRVLDVLDEQGLRDDTLVIVTTDHGIALPGMKCTLSDRGVGVMLMMRGPGGFAGGLVRDALVSQLDLFPTFCELVGIEAPGWLQGKSLLPVLATDAEIHGAVFAEVNYHVAYQPQRAVRERRWKYIRSFDVPDVDGQPNVDHTRTKDLLLQAGRPRAPLADEELYDLLVDPLEQHNLAGDVGAASELDQLRRTLHDWMTATRDPLLAGPVPPPTGADVLAAPE